MADITLVGYTLPWTPVATGNTNFTSFTADAPEETISLETPSMEAQVPMPIRALTVVQTDTQLQVTIDAPVFLDPATETHLTKRHWLFGSPPTVSNTTTRGTLTMVITRLLNRLSRLGRGVN